MRPKNKATKPRKNSVKKKKPEVASKRFYSEAQEFFLSGEHVTDSIIEHFANEMVEFINNDPTIMHIKAFRIYKGVIYDTYHDWLGRYPYLKARHDFCVDLIGLRREEKMASCDPKTLAHTLHMYSREWDKANKDKAALKNLEDERKTQPIKIVFDDYREKK